MECSLRLALRRALGDEQGRHRGETKSLAIGSLNAMGLAVSPKLVMNFKVVLMLLRRLGSVIRTMTLGAQKQGA